MKVTYFYNFLFGFFSKTRARGGVECRKGCQGIPINLHMLIAKHGNIPECKPPAAVAGIVKLSPNISH